jgi:hypothetical protein
VVCRRHVVDTHDLLWRNVAEHRDFLHRSGQQWFFTSTGDLNHQPGTTEMMKGQTYQVGEKT